VAVAFATAGTGAATTSGTVSVPYPTGLESGHVLVAHVLTWSGSAVTTPSGWTLITSGAPGGGSGFHAAFFKIADGSESGSLSVVTTGGGSAGTYGRMYRFTGAASTEGAGQEGGNSTTQSDRTVTTSGANRLAINLSAIKNDIAVDAFTGETGGTWSQAVSLYTSGTGNDAALQIHTAEMASAGTINGGSESGASTRDYNVIGFALVPGVLDVVGQAAETDTAMSITPALTPAGLSAPMGQAAETDSALSMTASMSAAEDIAFYNAVDFGDGYEQLEERVRSASVHRGRNSNLERVEAGTATTVYKNGDGYLDPANTTSGLYGSIRPLLPLRILRRADGVTYERFTGPIERWLPDWVIPTETEGYAEMAVEAADGFDTLANFVIESDYATLTTSLSGTNNDLVFTAREAGARGDEITVAYVVAGNDTDLDGETNEPLTGGAVLIERPQTTHDWAVKLFSSLRVRTSPPPSVFTVQGTDISITVSTDGSGNPTATASQIKAFVEATPALDALVTVELAPSNSGAGVVTAMAATSLSGGKWPQELSGTRITRILDLAGWPADLREIDTGDFQVVDAGFSVRDNVSALTHIQDVADSELGYVFMRGNNTFVYHDASHRNVDPRSTSSNATFSNTDVGFVFQGLQMSLDKDAIINEATVTAGAEGAVPQTVVDTTSQSIYGERVISRSTLLANDADCLAQATAIVEAFANPLQRVESLTTMETGLEGGWVESILALDIGDRITLVAKPPVEDEAFATTTNYELFVESVTDTYAPGQPLTLVFTTSAAEQSVAVPPPESDQYVLNNLGGILIIGDAVNGIIAA
jgi:hypothetical protein